MAESRLGERARSRLMHLVSDDHPPGDGWLRRLRALSELEGIPVFSEAVQLLFHLDVDDGAAERLLAHVLDHRADLSGRLGRDPGLRVAAMDYLSNVDRKLHNPKIVEMEAYEATERSARTDPLTRLSNRRVFDETLEREIRRSRRYRWPLTLLMLDLDRFKNVNDAWGHLLGDLVLERIGSVLRHAVREADVPCRFGGEEFAVILPETSRLGGYAVAERIRLRVAGAFREASIGGHEVAMTVSCGLACYPDDALHAAELVARADEALYGAKRDGRDRVAVRYREKRGATRFPVSPGAVVALPSDPEARGVDVSRSGILVATRIRPQVADTLAVHLTTRGPGRGDQGWDGAGRVVRVAAPEEEGAPCYVGLAFATPLPDERLRASVTLSRGAKKRARGTAR